MSLNHTRIYVVAESKDAFLKLSLAQDPSAGERACTLAGPLFIGEDICLDEETLPMFVNIIAEELGEILLYLIYSCCLRNHIRET